MLALKMQLKKEIVCENMSKHDIKNAIEKALAERSKRIDKDLVLKY